MTPLLFLLVPLLLAALLAAGATSVRSVSRIWLRHWAEQCLRGSEAASLYLERPQRLLLAAIAGIAACAGLAGALLVLGGARGAVLAAWLVGAGALLLLLGQLLPHAVARRWPVRLVPALLPLLSGFAWLATPAFAVGGRLSRRFRSIEPQTEEAAVRDELAELLRDSELEGIGERTENAIIAGVVRFGEKRVHDVMTPRPDIVAVDEGTPRAELARLVAASGYSRVPLFRGTIDDVTGVVHVFDLLDAERGAPDAARPVAFTGPAEPCSDLLVRMLERRQHLAIVRGDTGAVLGLVSLEDLLEALVGDIRDEHDERDDGTAPGAPRAV